MKLLPIIDTLNNSSFHSSDSRHNYIRNFKKYGNKWQWAGRIVRYTTNSDGYRCPEWEQCMWDASVLIFGCSHTFGIGVDDSQTIARQLEPLINKPVINLGAGGTNVMFQWVNTTILRKHNITPKAVIYMWPDPARCLEFVNSSGFDTHLWGPWSDSGFGLSWVTHPAHGVVYKNYVMDCCDVMWPCPVFHYELTSTEYFNDTTTRTVKLFQSDHARDMSHPGPASIRSWAVRMAEDLQTILHR